MKIKSSLNDNNDMIISDLFNFYVKLKTIKIEIKL